jgi:hypothetical protein
MVDILQGPWQTHGIYDAYGVPISIINPLPVSLTGVGASSLKPLFVTGTSVVGGAVTIADGSDITEGLIADAAVQGDLAGTVSAKLRGISKTLSAGLSITGPLTDTQLRASAVSVSLATGVTANAGTNLNTSALALETGGNLATLAGAVTGGKVKVTPDSVALPANQSVNQAQVAGTTTSVNSGNKDAGTQRVVLATDQPAVPVSGTFYQTTQPVSPTAATSGGATPYKFIAAAGANQDSTVVKNAAGQVFSIVAMCLVATARFVKLYDKASAPTSGDTPVHTLMIPANSTTGAGFSIPLSMPLVFANGISFRLTTGVADNDTGACTAADCVLNLGYK